MRGNGWLGLVLVVSLLGCRKPDEESSPPVEISAQDLYDAFEADSAGAAGRFAGRTLVITGMTASIFSGGPPGSHPAITLKTGAGPSVHCSGEALVHALAEVREGQTVTLECPGSTARFWPQPNGSIELDDCVWYPLANPDAGEAPAAS